MDDGLQNPGLQKTASLLVIDGAVGFGNGRVMPAGPLREPASDAAARCRAGVLIGPDLAGAARPCRGCRCWRRRLVPVQRLDGARVFAFSGIARPAKFHATLQEAGAELAGYAAFPDHHRFSRASCDRVLSAATESGAMPITTPKDAVRLPDPVRARCRGARRAAAVGATRRRSNGCWTRCCGNALGSYAGI